MCKLATRIECKHPLRAAGVAGSAYGPRVRDITCSAAAQPFPPAEHMPRRSLASVSASPYGRRRERQLAVRIVRIKIEITSSKRSPGEQSDTRGFTWQLDLPSAPVACASEGCWLPRPACGERSEFAAREFRVRGTLHAVGACGGSPSPQPSPRRRGEGAHLPCCARST